MAQEISYILITPYTILKSRTGGVIARLLSRTDIELVAAQIIAPTQELADSYAEALKETVGKRNPAAAEMFHDYIKRTFSPTGERRHRVMMLVFKGEDACRKLFAIAGDVYSDTKSSSERITGETIRDTYSDLVIGETSGKVHYFEPAVLTPPTQELALPRLKMFAEFAKNESNLVENVKYEDPSKIERTLVIIKPDNWRYPSSKPGNIIDMFSRTGLRIIGCKVYQMSVAEALEFYGPVKDVLREKLAPSIGEKAAKILQNKLSITIDDNNMQILSESIGKIYADAQFSNIIEFMSGTKPEECPEEDHKLPGKVKCMVLVYEGENAVKKIRDVLGPTDPTKAPSGTIRKEFGQNVMVNTAHASDSPENAQREMGIVKFQHNRLAEVIEEFLNSNK
jgi:nucleoside diphosphate kinase